MDVQARGTSPASMSSNEYIHREGGKACTVPDATDTTPLLSQKSYTSFNSLRSRASDEESQDVPQEFQSTFVLVATQFKIILQSALPVFGTQLLEYALLMTSVLAAGHVGKIELAACTLGSMTANVTAFSIVIGMAGALDTVLPGVWGASSVTAHSPIQQKGKTRSGNNATDSRLLGLWCQRMGVLYLLLLVPVLSIWLNAEEILLSLRQDKDVARLAARYLAMARLPAFSFNTVAKRYFQVQGLFSVPTKIGIVVAVIDILLTVILVFYPDPLPQVLAPYLHFGFDGAPLATSISYNVYAIGCVLWGWKIEKERRCLREAMMTIEKDAEEGQDVEIQAQSRPHSYIDSPTTAVEGPSSAHSFKSVSTHNISIDLDQRSETVAESDAVSEHEMRSAWYPPSSRALHPTGLGTLLTLGMAGVGQTASEWWAWELIGLAASVFGPTALAAQSVLIVTCSTLYQIPYALGVATSIRVGQLLGLARPRSAKFAAYAAIILGLAMSLTISLICFIWRKKWGYIFSNDEDVVKMVAGVLPLVASIYIFDANSGITGGILRARGKQGVGALLNMSAYYVVGVPLALYLAFKDRDFPQSLPDHPIVHSLNKGFLIIASSSDSSHLSSVFSSLSIALSTSTDSDDGYPSIPEATAGLRGLWTGLTVALVYCSVVSTILCLRTDWEHEVEKVKARLDAENERERRE
ncbi:hypothetical protein D9757_003303 [Collybiopsis confluens]|uniref:MATE efflux family protein n=1 Tax=Collybiopsis confluens TaxID=2823264 RepID=A0A8H5HZ38_9AGAR|nr:hypothetical protein D9757_003303 [Collybiopsis confluens]